LLGEGVDEAFTLFQDGSHNRGEIESLLLGTAITVLIVALLRGTTGFAQMFLGETLSQRVSNRLRMLYFDKLQLLSFSFHDRVHTGQLMSRGLSDIEGVRMFVQTGLVQIVRILMVLGAEKLEDGTWDFGNARELLLFCNGPWCGQSPRAIRNLVAAGYPPSKLFYYRGGMQNWQLLGLPVHVPAKRGR